MPITIPSLAQPRTKQNLQKPMTGCRLAAMKDKLSLDIYQTDKDLIIKSTIARANPNDIQIYLKMTFSLSAANVTCQPMLRRRFLLENAIGDHFPAPLFSQ